MPVLPDAPRHPCLPTCVTASALALSLLASACGTVGPSASDQASLPPSQTPSVEAMPTAPALPPRSAAPEIIVITPEPATDPTQVAATQLLALHERVRQLPAAEVQREVVRLAENSASPAAAVELALLLMQQRGSGDLVKALALLDGVVRSPQAEAGPWQAPARLLAARLAEQRRLEEQLERQNQQLREQQRRAEQLSGQLEALKAIERSLTNRQSAPPAAGNSPPPALSAPSAGPNGSSGARTP